MASSRLDVTARLFVHDDSREPSPEISLSAWLGPEPAYEKTARVWFHGAKRPVKPMPIELASLGISCRDLRAIDVSEYRVPFMPRPGLAPWRTTNDFVGMAALIESEVRLRAEGEST